MSEKPKQQQNPAAAYGEPWAETRKPIVGSHGLYLERTSGPFAGEHLIGLSASEYRRAKDCVNNLVGIVDPAAFMRDVEAMYDAVATVYSTGQACFNLLESQGWPDIAQKFSEALSDLRPFLPEAGGQPGAQPLNLCPCSFQHQPHDACDGSPAQTRLDQRAAKPALEDTRARFRFHRGSLEDSLKTEVRVANFKELKELVFAAHPRSELSEVEVKFYSKDERPCAFPETYIVTLGGHAVGFTDRMLKPEISVETEEKKKISPSGLFKQCVEDVLANAAEDVVASEERRRMLAEPETAELRRQNLAQQDAIEYLLQVMDQIRKADTRSFQNFGSVYEYSSRGPCAEMAAQALRLYGKDFEVPKPPVDSSLLNFELAMTAGKLATAKGVTNADGTPFHLPPAVSTLGEMKSALDNVMQDNALLCTNERTLKAQRAILYARLDDVPQLCRHLASALLHIQETDTRSVTAEMFELGSFGQIACKALQVYKSSQVARFFGPLKPTKPAPDETPGHP